VKLVPCRTPAGGDTTWTDPKPGDVVETAIDRLGTLVNPIVASGGA
jgi:hypothetical protein